MNKEEIEKELETINVEIEKLNTRKGELEKLYQSRDDVSIGERFRSWIKNGNAETLSDLFELEVYPETYNLIENMDLHRYSTVSILEYLYDDFYFLTEPNGEGKLPKNSDKMILVATEMMEGNFDSVVIDW